MTESSSRPVALPPQLEVPHAAFNAAVENTLSVVAASEPTVAQLIQSELDNQRSQLKLIASENYASPAVLLTMGNWLSDKYAEGIPGQRYYAGCEYVDQIELLANEHAKALFNADYAYVQPHSGIDANLVAFWAILSHRIEAPFLKNVEQKSVFALSEQEWAELRAAFNNQRMIGMSLDAGGHLTHGFRPNISGKLFDQRSYGVNPETERVDYDEIAKLAKEFKPLVIVAGYSAYPRAINFAKMREIADSVDATLMVDMAHFAGLVAGKVLTGDENPIPFADIVTSTTHKSLRGPRGGIVLSNNPELAPHIDKGCPMVLGGPMAHVMAAKAVAFAEARQDSFAGYAHQVRDNAASLAEEIAKRGGRIVTGGTDNHLCLVDVTSFGLTGRQAESALEASGVIVNRNSIPNDVNGAWYTSGIRLGTCALTSLGMKEAEMVEVAELITTVLKAASPSVSAKGKASRAKYILEDSLRDQVRERCADLLSRHRLYAELTVI